jgi:myosin heavy subunit
MSFNYHKHKGHGGDGDSFWTSYSDLFLGLSTIFLLLYVITSLRTGTDSIKNMIENQNLRSEVQNLQTQLKMYESMKSDYLQNQAPQDEIKEYQELMDKLTLLQEEAKDESEKLKRQAMENAAKGKALNKYQQMVRNILNANKVAKVKIVNRNDLIDEQDVEIDDQQQQIGQLEQDVTQKKRMIEATERKIADANEELERRIKEVERQRKANKLNAKAYQKKLAQLKKQNETEIEELQAKTESYEEELNKSQNQLSALTGQLQATTSKLAAKEGEAAALQTKIAGLRGEFEAEKARDRAGFEAALAKEKLSGKERAAREAAFRAEAAAKERALGDRIAGLSGELAKAKAEMDARKGIAKEIAAGFARAGIKADVDMKTGDVVIDFGNNYFESDSARLKPQMKSIIEKAMPVYSKSLFGNPKVANQISSVEVIGFASPTYKGRFVDPNSRRPEDIEAMKYNMDLSYRRANAIFSHVISDGAMKFQHHDRLVKKMKVSGRSFLEVFSSNRSMASSQDFCKVNDCRKAQRVIIRFSMDGK